MVLGGTSRTVPASRWLVFLLISVAGCAIDLSTKAWIFQKLGMPNQSDTLWIWPRVFGFTTSLNEGALFGVGQGYVVGFATLSFLAAAFIVWWLFYAGAARDWMLTIALAMVTAGICGNLYDRLGLPGNIWPNSAGFQRAGHRVFAVRDWLDVRLIHYHYPIFNIADSLLVVGAVLLFWHVWIGRESRTDSEKTPAAEKTVKPIGSSVVKES